MQITLMPSLTQSERETLGLWLEECLQDQNFCSSFSASLNNKICVYVGRTYYVLRNGTWQKSHPNFYVGGPSNEISMGDRLQLLLTLIPLTDNSSYLHEEAEAALLKYLLGEYGRLREGIVSTTGEFGGLAFEENVERPRIASLINGVWMLPGGEPVEVGNGWRVAAAQVPDVPVVEESEIEPDVEF